MKKIIIAVTVIAVLLLVGNNYYQTRLAKSKTTQVADPTINTITTVSPSPVLAPQASENETRQVLLATVNISGFDCPTCPISAEYALKDQKGVFDAQVTQTGEGSRILYDASQVSLDDMRKLLAPFTIDVISEEPSVKLKLD